MRQKLSKVPKKQKEKNSQVKSLSRVKYIEAVGRRKEAVARVRVSKKEKSGFLVNEKSLNEYFPLKNQHYCVQAPLNKLAINDPLFVSVKVKGGGLSAQAEAIRLGLSRCLVKIDDKNRFPLRKFGFLTRDTRVVERKKYGLKKARRAPQWQKR